MTNNTNLTCKCGFKFTGPGEFRNSDAFITAKGDSGVVCPKCGAKYVNGQKVEDGRGEGR